MTDLRSPDVRIHGLNALRAFAALAVLTTHVGFQTGLTINQGLVSFLLARLDSGVAIFFCLSGFLLSRPFLAAARDGRPGPDIVNYWWKRCLRILPPYWIAVTMGMLLVGENLHRAYGADVWLPYFTLSSIYFPIASPAGLTQMWSLCVEISFYVVLPLLAWGLTRALCRRRWRPQALLSACVAMLAINVAWYFAVFHLPAPYSRLGVLWLPAYLSWFAGGMAVAVISLTSADDPSFAGRARRVFSAAASAPGLCWLCIGLLYFVAATPLTGPEGFAQVLSEWNFITKNLMFMTIATGMLITTVFAPEDDPWHRFMASRPMSHLGEISYGVFCYHVLILYWVFGATDTPLFQGHFWWIWTLTGLSSLLLAQISYTLVEKPLLRYKSLVRGRTKTDATANETPTKVTT